MHASFAIPVTTLAAARRAKFGLAAFAILSAASILAAAEPAIRILKGANQQTVYASAFPAPLVVWVSDPATQNPLAGVKVAFTAGSGIGLSSQFAVTDERGLAAVTATGLSACTSSVSAEIAGAPATRVQFDKLVVNKAVLTVLPGDLEMSVGGKVPAISEYTIQGFVNGDTEASAQISGTPVLTTTARDLSPRANYAIKGGVGTLSSPNYDFVAGFGTLAVVDELNSDNDRTTTQEASLPIGAQGDAAEVRPALTNQPSANSLLEPSFLAGLHGESGVFVQSAIWQAAANLSGAMQTASVRNAMLPKAADSAIKPAASVRQAVVNKAAPTPAAQIAKAPVRPAVAKSTTPAPATPGAGGSVHAVVLNAAPAASANASSSYSGTAIRKAFNPPGTN